MTALRVAQAIDAYRRADERRAAAVTARLRAEADEATALREYESAKAELLAANAEAFR